MNAKRFCGWKDEELTRCDSEVDYCASKVSASALDQGTFPLKTSQQLSLSDKSHGIHLECCRFQHIRFFHELPQKATEMPWAEITDPH